MEGARTFLPPSALELVIHHAPCDDGEAAAALFWKQHPQLLFRGLHPKDALLTEEMRALVLGKHVVLVDICWGEAVMRKLCDLAAKVLVLDHHVTNQKTMETLLLLPNLHCVFVMGEPGVSLAWRYLGGNRANIYPALRYIGMRDVWQHKQCQEAEFFCAAFARPKRWEDWLPYMYGDEATDRLIAQGRVIHAYQQQQLRTMAEKVVHREWQGYWLAIVNVPFPWISELGELLCEEQPERTVAVI